jgi:5-methylthioadenosine/S-adenosylhomocysteine deaminase
MTLSMNEPAAPTPIDILVRHCDVVTLDAAATVRRDAAIAISDGRIAWIGPTAEATRFTAETTLDGSGRIAMPGLIDAHVHTAQQLLRGKLSELGRRMPLKIPVWKNYYVPFEGMLTPDDMHLSGLVAYANMLRVGTTCFAESGGPHPDAMGQAADEVGIRGFVALSTVDQNDGIGAAVPPSMLMTSEQALRRNVDLVQHWSTHPRVKATLALRQIIVCSPPLIQAMAAAARELGVKIHTHLCEGTYEIDYALEKFGRRPTEWLDGLGVLGNHLHCAHSVLLAPEEVDLYVQHGLSVCHCAFGNYAIGVPRIIEMARRGVPIGLGTDGAAGFGTLDLFQVAHATRVGQQAVAGTPCHIRTPISSEQILRMATQGAAQALGMGAEIGSLEVGKKADILLVDATEMDQLPLYDPLFVAATVTVGRDVRSVIIDGRLVMKEREILTIDMEALRARLKRQAPQIMARFEALVA